MATAEFADGPEGLDEQLLDAKAALVREIINKHEFLKERFKHVKRTDFANRIELAVTPESVKTTDGDDQGYFYDLSAVLMLDEEKPPVEEHQVDDEMLVIYHSPHTAKCLVPPDWVMEALDNMDPELRERLALYMTESKRAQLETETGYELSLAAHLEALQRAYHHILGDDEDHRV